MRRIAGVALLVMACGGSEAETQPCDYTRSTEWHGSIATVRLYDGAGAMAAWCEVPAGAPLQAACADGNGAAVLVAASCVEGLPTDAPPR